MPSTTYLNITIGNQPVDVSDIEEFPIAINYSIEDPENFQSKKSNEALNARLPATRKNRRVANSFHDAGTEDLTPGQVYRSHQPSVIEADGNELLNGKAFLVGASHTDNPTDYEFSFYGGNADWLIDLKEKTIYDYVQNISFLYGVLNIINSWGFDGRNEQLPYVFAPVKYRGFMDPENGNDDNFSATSLRPSISKYWLLYWTFKSLGYRLAPGFVDTDYFRRQVMPWTWGNFLNSEGTKLDVHKFLAKSTQERFINAEYNDFLEVYVTDTGLAEVYDNNNEFTYLDKTLTWEYKAPFSGALDAYFKAVISTSGNLVGENSFFTYQIHWSYLAAGSNTETTPEKQLITARNGANLSRGDYTEFTELTYHHIVNPGDKILARFYLQVHEGKGIGARVNFHTKIEEFSLSHFAIPFNGLISFSNYTGFKKFKILDFIAGICDEFNISPVTDNINKIVYFEPLHKYNLEGVPQKGYFNEDFIDWEDKIDFSKQWDKELFSDYEKELYFKYKDDQNDGPLKTLQDRHQTTLAGSKYLFPDRFKAGKREYENRFFSPTVHFDCEQFAGITGIAPQMVCIVPENISNTSNSEADNTFQPKSCYYKGLVTGVGGWRLGGQEFTSYPYMFAVNYKPGGELDPVLSYSDEKIGNVVAMGLMKKFFIQRLAIMRKGEFYSNAWFLLKNIDVSRLHREHKLAMGQRWELVQIKNYLPLKSESTATYLRKWTPVMPEDVDNSFPSEESVLNNNITLAANDVKYNPLKCLATDIPK